MHTCYIKIRLNGNFHEPMGGKFRIIISEAEKIVEECSMRMRKCIFITMVIVLFSSGLFSSNFSINLNVNYNYGISDFFDESQTFFTYAGKNFVERRNNYLGFGFNISVSVPVIKDLYVVPGFSLKFGHQDYQYEELTDDTDAESDKNNYFFDLMSGELDIVYDLFHFKSDWRISLSAGLTYNQLNADDEMRVDEKAYWGFRPGIGIKFLQTKRFGFRLFVYYELPFDSEMFSYLGVNAGIMIRI